MGAFVKKKLFYQTLAFILPLAVLPIVITCIILTLSSYQFFQKTVHQDYIAILQTAADAIGMFIGNAQDSMESLARVTTSVKLDAWGKEMALTAFIYENPQFSSIDLVSADRKTGIAAASAQTAPTALHADLIDRALSGSVAITGVLTAKNGIPYVDIAVPVLRLGKVAEVLCGRLSLKYLWDILEKIRIGKAGEAYVMDLSGCAIAHREMDQVVCRTESETPEIITRIRTSGKPVEWVKTTPKGDFYHLGMYAPKLDWIVAIRQPRQEVYAFLYGNIAWAFLITVLICIGVSYRGWRGSQRLLSPIRNLHRQVMEVSQGNLDRKVSFDREDEIGDLGVAFNQMTTSLKKYVEHEVETARTLAHAKNLATLGTVASKVSHEMGNFLFGIQMIMKGLKKEPLSENGLNILKTIENDVAQTRIFTQEFLKFAKKPTLNFARRSLVRVIREVLEAFRPEANGRGIILALNWDPAISPIRIDAVLMHQVFTNLVKNGLEAMAGAGNLTITGKAAGEHLLVSVSDTGPGVDAETYEKLFEPFFTTKGVLGTGLGLSIVKSSIEAHGGTIECVSEPGKGTEFLIRLPME